MDKDKVYYNKNSVIFRSSKITDIGPIARRMRKADRDEIWASSNVLPKAALEMGFVNSNPCLTIEYKGEPIAMFGVVPKSSSEATVWLLGTGKVKKIQTTFLKVSHKFMVMLLDHYPTLYNFVDVRNKISIEWLKWCKAVFGEAVEHGIDKMPFAPFVIRRESYV